MSRSPRVPKYRLHRASGQAVVTLGGHDHYLGLFDSPESHELYRRLVAEWLAGGQGAVTERAPDLTVAEALAAYWSHAKSYYVKNGEPTSQQDRVKRSLSVALDLYGSTQARAFGPTALKACRQHMVVRGWCRRVVNQRTACLVRAWKWCVSEELVPPAVYQGLKAVEGLRRGRTAAPESAPVLPVPEPDLEAALLCLPPMLADVARLQLLTAMRPGEALALCESDLDRSGAVWRYVPASHKTEHRGHDRLVLIGPRAQELLAPYLGHQLAGEPYAFSPRASVAAWRARQRAARKSPVQPSQAARSKGRPRKAPGERYRLTSYDRAIALACKRAGVAHWHPHQLRHNAATRLVEQFGWEVARIILGHRTLDATRIYGEDSLARAIAAVEKVG